MERNNHAAKLPKHIHDDKNGLNYTLHSDYYLPDLEYHTTCYEIRRWGRMRLEYLRKNHQTWLNRMMLEGTLNDHLHQIDIQCQERYDILMEGYKRCWKITEELKVEDQMKWVQLMNLAKAEAERNIMQEIIFE